MSKRIFDVDPLTGITTYHVYDPVNDITSFERVQDVKPFLDANKALANDGDYKRKGIKDSWMHAATIPNIVIEQWLKEGIDIFNKDHWPQVRRKLNDPNWKHLKTIVGRI